MCHRAEGQLKYGYLLTTVITNCVDLQITSQDSLETRLSMFPHSSGYLYPVYRLRAGKLDGPAQFTMGR